MSVIKQISVYNGSFWEGPHDIGASAENVKFYNANNELITLANSDNVKGALSNLIGSNKLAGNRAVGTTAGGILTYSDTTVTELNYLSGTTSKVQTQIDNINDKIGRIDISSIGDGTITGIIGDADISSIGDGTITGAIDMLNTNFQGVKKIKHTVRSFLLSSGGSAQLTFSDGTPITYPKYNVIQCHTASTSSGGNTIALPVTVYNNVFWISGRDTVNWDIVTNRNVSVDIVYYQI